MSFAGPDEIARLQSLGRQLPKPADAQGRTVRHWTTAMFFVGFLVLLMVDVLT